MKYTVSLIVASVASALLFTACGGGGSAEENAAANMAETSAAMKAEAEHAHADVKSSDMEKAASDAAKMAEKAQAEAKAQADVLSKKAEGDLPKLP